MESYYICTSYGTFGFRLQKDGEEWKIDPQTKSCMESAMQCRYPGSHLEVMENEEGIFLHIRVEGNDVVPEYKLFKSKRQDFVLEEKEETRGGWFDYCTLL
jgi:hypothetical protein